MHPAVWPTVRETYYIRFTYLPTGFPRKKPHNCTTGRKAWSGKCCHPRISLLFGLPNSLVVFSFSSQSNGLLQEAL
jgi:hypothetical protein